MATDAQIKNGMSELRQVASELQRVVSRAQSLIDWAQRLGLLDVADDYQFTGEDEGLTGADFKAAALGLHEITQMEVELTAIAKVSISSGAAK